ncbi:MAG: hypothetical protein HOC91_09115 [Nitrospinaceae bacterium]|jgi:hypothetical protein|nr:hypothetical protein [Nitrospinaceae bacterium]MBT4093146.1 hypothetical protein [Nitrospinaceae bacterium]MBT4430659.1 hypothetical protein [Nitrospinaceae bacterium]MBT5369735.1 hypothetical protein [Nitrospinaceae bacterium]MBT5949067.1 hypothetical protein [Nitrospinaceae bacterium]
MSEAVAGSEAKHVFARNFREHMEGRLSFGEWFESHKVLEKRFGPEPWPAPEAWLASGPIAAS